MGLYSKDEIVGILREAHEAVTEAGVPDDLRAQAFAAAVQGLAAKNVLTPPPVAVDLSRLARAH